MRKIIVGTIVALILAALVAVASANSGKPRLPSDGGSAVMQQWATDPAKCFSNYSSGGSLKRGSGGWHGVDITNWLGIRVYPNSNGKVTYNGSATQSEPVYTGTRNEFYFNQTNPPSSISINQAGTICGM